MQKWLNQTIFITEICLLRYYFFQDKNDKVNANVVSLKMLVKPTKYYASTYNTNNPTNPDPSRQILGVHGINISKSIRARLDANRRDKNDNIRRLGVAAARYPCDVNGFIISKRQRCARDGGNRHRMYLARDVAKSREKIGKLLEGNKRRMWRFL